MNPLLKRGRVRKKEFPSQGGGHVGGRRVKKRSGKRIKGEGRTKGLVKIWVVGCKKHGGNLVRGNN